MKNIKKFISATVACVITACSCLYVSDSKNNGLNYNMLQADAATSYSEQCKEMLDLINQYRAEYGVAPVKLYITASQAAQVRAGELKQTFSHDRPDGSSFDTVLDNYAFDWWTAGENIASGFPNVEMVMSAWMNSEGHRANILSEDYEWVGIGIVDNAYWVQIFLGDVSSSDTLGDPSGDGAINAIDASLTLEYYAYKATAPHFDQTNEFIAAANVNKDSNVDALDASEILAYYADKATGGNPSFD